MKALKFSIHIAAPREIVWNTLWNDDTYKKWTSVFHEGSYVITDWREGSKILFMSPTGEGINSVIDRKVPYEYMSFRHNNMFKNQLENTGEPDDWSGAMETYFLHEEDGITELKVEMDVEEYALKYFESTFPLALKKVKELAEVPQHHKVY